jgi:hypothetical protein
MAAHRKLDRRRDDLCAVGLCKLREDVNVQEIIAHNLNTAG